MSNKKAYLYHVTDDMRASLVDFIKDTQGYVDRKVVPPKPEDAGRSKCTYCSYQSQCKKDG
jgi:CRISPR/Cas system-associated exonuclease Cas4 (RecB family)